MAGTEKRAIRFCIKLARPVRADGGKGEQLFPLADHEKSLVAEVAVHSVRGVVSDRASVYHSFPASDGGTANVAHGLAARDYGDRSQNDELPAIYTRIYVLWGEHIFNTRIPSLS
jgi:hypothetical protein